MTNEEKIKQAEQLIKEVLINEEENFNGNDSSLVVMNDDVLCHIVNHWYTIREESIFSNYNGVEIDEHLNIEEINLINE